MVGLYHCIHITKMTNQWQFRQNILVPVCQSLAKSLENVADSERLRIFSGLSSQPFARFVKKHKNSISSLFRRRVTNDLCIVRMRLRQLNICLSRCIGCSLPPGRNTGLWLVQIGHVTWILACDLSRYLATVWPLVSAREKNKCFKMSLKAPFIRLLVLKVSTFIWTLIVINIEAF